MIRKLILPLLGLAGFIFAVMVVVQGSVPVKAAPAVAEPAKSPYAQFVAGAGLIEAQSENIAIGTPVSGVVADVCVGLAVWFSILPSIHVPDGGVQYG